MKVNAIKCVKCNDIIYSRARHDYHSCSCGGITIDGGLDYIRYGWANDMERPNAFEFDIGEITLGQLYQDYNKRIDKYGWFPERKVKKGKLKTDPKIKRET